MLCNKYIHFLIVLKFPVMLYIRYLKIQGGEIVTIKCPDFKISNFVSFLKAQSLHSVNSIKSFDFSTLYTTIPHDKLKSKLKKIINQCFFHKNGNRRFQYVVIGYKDTYLVRDHSDAPQKYSDAEVIQVLEYLIDNIFVEFGGRIFQQTIVIPMGTNCAPVSYLPTCFYTRMRQNLYKVSSKQARNTSHNNSISPTDI